MARASSRSAPAETDQAETDQADPWQGKRKCICIWLLLDGLSNSQYAEFWRERSEVRKKDYQRKCIQYEVQLHGENSRRQRTSGESQNKTRAPSPRKNETTNKKITCTNAPAWWPQPLVESWWDQKPRRAGPGLPSRSFWKGRFFRWFSGWVRVFLPASQSPGVDRRNRWLIGWFSNWVIDWLTNRVIDWSICWSIGWLIG